MLTADILNFWSSNPFLSAALPVSSVYIGLVPENLSLPYVSIFPVSAVPTELSCSSRFETHAIQVSIFAGSLSEAEEIAAVVEKQFRNCRFNLDVGGCIQTGKTTVQEGYGWTIFLEFDILLNRDFAY